MGLTLDHLPHLVAKSLRSYYRRKRFYQFARVLIGTAILYLLLALVAAHIDRFSFLEVAARVRLFWAAHLLAGAFGLVCFLLFALRRPTVQQIAYELESKLSPDANEMFVTLDDVLSNPPPMADPVWKELLDQLEQIAVDYSDGVRSARLVRDRCLRALLGVFLALCGVCLLLSFPKQYQFPLMTKRFFFPERELPRPSFIKISVSPDELVLGKGGEAVIRAEISGRIPRPLRWLMKQLGMTTSRCVLAMHEELAGPFVFRDAAKADMTRISRTMFLFSRGDLQKSLRFKVRCGDAETAARLVDVVSQPEIRDVTLFVTAPAYANRPVEPFTDVSQPLRFLPGSQIKVVFKTDQPVVTRTIRFEKGKEDIEPEWDEKALTGTHEFELKEPVTFEIEVVNARGFGNVDKTKVTIGVREDTPPSVRLDFPVSDLERVPGELVPIQGEVKDDLGVTEVSVRFILNPSPDEETAPKEIPVGLKKSGETTVPIAAGFDLAKTGAVPGDLLSVQVRARDTAGNDGFSIEFLIRVVSFTRGENERRRLRFLRFLGAALETLAACPKPERPVTTGGQLLEIERDCYEEIASLAKKHEVALPSASSLKSLLTALEREHHFTDAPRHKEDLRKLHGALLAAGAPLSPQPTEDLFASRSQQAKLMAEEVLPGLTGYRQLKNLTWRLFGMRYEAGRIQEKLAELLARPDPDQKASLARRAELYLKTIQAIGADLITLYRVTQSLDEERVKGLVGDLNTAGYYMKSKSLKKKAASCEEVARLISTVLAGTQPALLTLFERERAARAKLAGRYRQSLEQIAQTPVPSVDPEAWLANAAEWLASDEQLMERNPFLPLWPRFVDLALLEGLRRVEEAPDAASRVKADAERVEQALALVNAGQELGTAIRREREAADALALDWESAAIGRIESISGAERALAVLLLEIEEADRAGTWAGQVRSQKTQALAQLDLSKEPPAPPSGRVSPRIDHSYAKALTEAANAHFAARSTTDELERLVAQLQRFRTAIAQLAHTLKSSDTKTAAPLVTEALARFSRELGRVQGSIRWLALRQCWSALGDGVKTGTRDDLVILELRQAVSRCSVRAQQSLGGFGGSELDTLHLASLSTHLERLIDPLMKQFERLRTSYQDGTLLSEKNVAKYVILAELTKTRRYLDTTKLLLAGNDQERVAREFVKEFEEVGLTYLAANVSLVVTARKLLEAGDAVLQSRQVDIARFDTTIEDALRQLRELKAVVQELGTQDLRDRLAGTIEPLLNRVTYLKFQGSQSSAVEIKRRRFALGEVLRDLTRLERTINSVAYVQHGWESKLRGGPAEIWAREHRFDADTSRKRLIGQARLGFQVFSAGVLEALKERPNHEQYSRSFAWAVFLHSLLRSDLCRVGGVRPPRSGEEQKGDPRLKWLQAELEKARQIKNLKHYGPVTKEYLDSMADFLRY